MPKLSDREMGRRRAALIAAARVCFARRGFEETSMDEVCAEAGISKGALYGHFKSKDELILAVAEERASWLQEIGKTSTADDLLAELTRLIGRREGDFSAAQLEIFAVARSLFDPELRAVFLRNEEVMLASLEQVMERLSPVLPPDVSARLLATLLMGVAVLGSLQPDERRGDDVRALLQLLVGGPVADPR